MWKPELGFREQTVKVVAMQDRRKWLSQMLVGACQISAGSFLAIGGTSITQAQSKNCRPECQRGSKESALGNFVSSTPTTKSWRAGPA